MTSALGTRSEAENGGSGAVSFLASTRHLQLGKLVSDQNQLTCVTWEPTNGTILAFAVFVLFHNHEAFLLIPPKQEDEIHRHHGARELGRLT